MKIDELRIGDCVKFAGEVFQIDSLTHSGIVSLINKESYIMAASVDQLQPIDSAEDEMQETEKRHTVLITWNDARNPPDHDRKVLLMNRRAGVEYSTGWYDRECEQWHVDDRTMIAVDYWREIHE